MASLAEFINEKTAIEVKIKEAESNYRKILTELTKDLINVETEINYYKNSLDVDKIRLAETIIEVSDYSKGGQDKKSCVDDAIQFFSSGERLKNMYYGDLWEVYFGTKNYDRWYGQRCDGPYGTSPRHGYISFKIAVKSDVRKNRKQSDLTTEEVDAILYYLLNLAGIQESKKSSTTT